MIESGVGRPALVVLLLATLAPVSAAPVSAQWKLGAQGVFNNVLDGSWGLGGRVGFAVAPVGSTVLQLQGTGDIYFPDCGAGRSCDLADFQLNALFVLASTPPYEPYLGGGISLQPVTRTGVGGDLDKTEVGPVAIIGTRVGFWGRVEPFVEAKWLFKDELGSQFALEFGMVVELGRIVEEEIP